MSDTRAKEANPTAAPASRLVLEDSQAPAGDPHELERELRLFHLRSAGASTGGAGFVPAVLWNETGGGASVHWDPEPLRSACAAQLGAAPEDDIPFGGPDTAALRMFARAAVVRSEERRAAFARRTADLVRKLRELLDVDRAKRESRSADHLSGSIGAAGAGLLDTSALSDRLGRWRGAASLEPQRRTRLETVVDTLTGFAWDGVPHVVVVHDSADSPLPKGLPGVEVVRKDVPVTDALAVFDEQAESFSELFRAIRIATLEAAGRFDAQRHGPWVDHLDPASFSSEERQLVPIVVADDGADGAASRDLPAFTRFLLSDRPVHLLLRARPPRLTPDEEPALELGYLAVAHRKAFVQQSSLGAPEHLLAGILRGFDHMRPALHVVLTDGGDAPQGAFVAALHARVHPHFRYDPQAGTTWAGRMDFSGNPAADEDWPDTVVEFDRGSGTESTFLLPVTGADWALLRGDHADEFLPVPDGASTETLTPLGTYLGLSSEEAMERIPYVWGASRDGRMRRLVVTRRLTIGCRERLDFWHTLQELAGIRSEYVLEAVRRTRAEAEAQAAEEREAMAAAHAEAVEEARRTAVSDAMRALSNRLLDLDVAMPLAAAAPAAAGAPAAEAPAAATPAPAPAAEPGPAVVSDEPWIDTPLCTSCNDCINVNSVLFTYDGNKQAIIGDPQGGTFAQLVMAAEKCPARCIHPGMPLNPEESGLEDLLRRAKPFQ